MYSVIIRNDAVPQTPPEAQLQIYLYDADNQVTYELLVKRKTDHTETAYNEKYSASLWIHFHMNEANGEDGAARLSAGAAAVHEMLQLLHQIDLTPAEQAIKVLRSFFDLDPQYSVEYDFRTVSQLDLPF